MPDDTIPPFEFDKKARKTKYNTTYYARHREYLLQKQKEYAARPDVNAKIRAYKKDPKFKENRRAADKKWRKNNPDKAKQSDIKDAKKRDDRYEAISGRPRPEICDICGGNISGIVFDHCHEYGHFRGWLCNRCNRVLGAVRDDPILLELLAAYLREYELPHIT